MGVNKVCCVVRGKEGGGVIRFVVRNGGRGIRFVV